MIPYIRGRVTPQAHVNVPEGTFEEEYAREGFFGRYAHLYRAHPPVDWLAIDGPLRPQAFDLRRFGDIGAPAGGDLLGNRKLLLLNGDVEIASIRVSATMPYYFRNADGDEVFFVHAGTGRLETDFGPLAYRDGDYLHVPRGTTYRFVPAGPTELLNILAFSEIRFPDKGMLGQHALFDPALLKVPEPEKGPSAETRDTTWELRIRRCGQITRVTYPHCPIDVVGWKGTLTAWALNVRDIRPVICERYHLPPSAHTTMVAGGFVICTFLPRGLETGDPDAMKVPFYHSNIDYDEVLFYHSGQFFSRAGMFPGMMTFHPQGIHHGPQADAVRRSKDLKRTEEVAVMIDTRRPLELGPAASSVEVADYWRSWSRQGGK